MGEPGVAVPVAVLFDDEAVGDVDEAAALECEGAAGGRLAGEGAFPSAGAGPFEGSAIVIDEQVVELGGAVGEGVEEVGEAGEQGGAADGAAAGRVDGELGVDGVLVVERGGRGGVVAVEGGESGEGDFAGGDGHV